MSNDDMQRRRHFLKQAIGSIGLTLGASAITSIVTSCEVTETAPTTPTGKVFIINIASITELASPGGIVTKLITGLNDNRPVFLSRVSDTAVAVFDTTCTHQSCPVDLPRTAGGNCICACHGAEYSSVNGNVLRQPISGSATNLRTFTATFDPATKKLTITT